MKAYTTALMDINKGIYIITAEISGNVFYHVDAYYGEDADGNRGMSRVFVDGIRCLLATNGDEVLKLTDSEKEEAEEILIRKFLEG